MRLDLRLAMVGVFFALLLGVAAWSRAQTAVAPNPVSPVVLAGPDIGFRMTGVKRGTPSSSTHRYCPSARRNRYSVR